MNICDLSIDERQFFDMGRDEALRFRRNQGGIYQTIFKAETEDYKLQVGYDDVDFGVYIAVTFKRRFDRDGAEKNVMVPCGTAKQGIARIAAFLERHPPEEPYCAVDY